MPPAASRASWVPCSCLLYTSDTGRVPYGSRGREIIRQYARQDIRFLLSHDVKFIIAACGTVSSTDVYKRQIQNRRTVAAARRFCCGGAGEWAVSPKCLLDKTMRLVYSKHRISKC